MGYETHGDRGTLSNEEILEIRKKHFLPTAFFYHKEPIQLVKAQGNYVWDSEGKQYLDSIGGIVCISAGHNHPKIKEKMKAMLDQDEIQHTSLIYLSAYPTELAQKLVPHAPSHIDRCAFVNSGSEANELAFLAARQKTGETTLIHLRHSYHGGTSGALAACGHHNWRFQNQPVTAVASAMEPYCYRCPFGKKPDSCSLECAQNIESTIQTTTHGKIAAFIAEPVMGVGGFIDPPKEYFEEACRITHKYGGLYISDEVQTGAGRCGEEFFLTKKLGIQADMMTLAKGLGNGAAIGCVMMSSDAAGPMKGKVHFNTFGGDPYQTMQATQTVEIIEEEKLAQNAQDMGTLLKDGLTALMKDHPLIGDVRGRGLLLGMELVKDRKTKEYATAETATLMDRCKDKGVLLGKGGLFGNVLRIAPPLGINRQEVQTILKVIDEGLSEIEKKV